MGVKLIEMLDRHIHPMIKCKMQGRQPLRGYCFVTGTQGFFWFA
jgi:hypothetical protein